MNHDKWADNEFASMKQVFKEQLEKFETVILGILILYESIYLVCQKNSHQKC